jgi:hypothetical protein
VKKTLLFLISVPFLVLFFHVTYLFAARPLTTDDAWTIEKGQFQLELGFDAARQDTHDKELSPSMTLSYGLLERLDLGIGAGYLYVDPKEGSKEKGFSDTELKLKYRPIDEKGWMPALAVTGALKIPTASESKGLGSGQTDFGMNAIVTKNFGKRFAIHLNLGYTFVGEDKVDNELNYSIGTQFILSQRWTVVGEIVGANNLNDRNGDDPLSGLIGACCLITDKMIWDAGLEIGMSKAAPDFRLTTGVTFLFKP